MSILGRALSGGLIKPVVDGGVDIVLDHGKTKRTEMQLWALVELAAAAWRPWIAYIVGWTVAVYFAVYILLVLFTWFQLFIPASAVQELVWMKMDVIGGIIFRFAGSYLGIYATSRGTEKVAEMFGGKIADKVGRVARVVTGSKPPPDQASIVREQMHEPGPIQKMQGVAAWWQGETFDGIDAKRLAKEITFYEGVRHRVYLDTLGNKTAGIGHKLTVHDSEFNYEVGAAIGPARVDEWFRDDLLDAVNGARYVVSGFDGLPHDLKLVLCNMCFQLGVSGLSDFVKMLEAISRRDWLAVSREMLNSKWASQTPSRARKLSARVLSLKNNTGV